MPVEKSISADMDEKHPGGHWATERHRHIYITKDGQLAPETAPKTMKVKGGKLGEKDGKNRGSSDRIHPSHDIRAMGRTANPGNDETGQNARTSRRNTKVLLVNGKKLVGREAMEGSEGVSAVYQVFSPQAFHDAIVDAKKGNPYGAFVTAYDADDYKGNRMFLLPKGEAGFSLTPEGDIVSVFKNPKKTTEKKVTERTLLVALAHGGKTLDCFDGFLPQLYAQHGFKAVCKLKFDREYAPEGWDYERDGEPDVVFFAHNGDNLKTVLTKRYSYPKYSKEDVPYAEDYETAVQMRDTKKSISLYINLDKSLLSMIWKEDLHPRGFGGKFNNKPQAPKAPQQAAPQQPKPQYHIDDREPAPLQEIKENKDRQAPDSSGVKQTTKDMHQVNGRYTPERSQLHAQWIEEIVASAGENPPGEKPTVIIMGGGSAAGKSTMRDKLILPGMAQLGYQPAVVDCDDIKDKIPEFKQFKIEDRKSAAVRVHGESSDVAKEAMTQLVKAGKSFILDGTMRSPSTYEKRIAFFKEHGYEVQIIIADAPLHESFRRANSRSEEMGREVPLDIIRESHAAVPGSLEKLKGLVDDFAVFDTTGDSPGLIHSPDYTNEAKYKAFRRKGGLS